MDHHGEHDDEQQAEDTNPERQGPTSPGGPADPPTDPDEQGPSGPPHESVPGDQGEVPNPKR